MSDPNSEILEPVSNILGTHLTLFHPDKKFFQTQLIDAQISVNALRHFGNGHENFANASQPLIPTRKFLEPNPSPWITTRRAGSQL